MWTANTLLTKAVGAKVRKRHLPFGNINPDALLMVSFYIPSLFLVRLKMWLEMLLTGPASVSPLGWRGRAVVWDSIRII